MTTLYVHPAAACVCILCALYALYLGIKRRRSKSAANRHEALGSIALGGFIVVSGAGLIQTFQREHTVIPFETHFFAALVVVGFAVAGLVSGHLLAAGKTRNRKRAAYVHGIAAGLGLLAALGCAYTGLGVLSAIALR